MPTSPRGSPGMRALGVFFALGVGACVLAAGLLLFPGSALDAVWRVNPRGHEGFLRMGAWALLLLASVAVACAFAAVGLWRNTAWGRPVALGILSVNLVGDAANVVWGHDPRSLIGVPVALALIVYLLRRPPARPGEREP